MGVASQFLGSDRDVGLGKPKTCNFREPETSHFIIFSNQPRMWVGGGADLEKNEQSVNHREDREVSFKIDCQLIIPGLAFEKHTCEVWIYLN